MAINIQIPKGEDAIPYISSFSEAFHKHPEMQSCLLGVEDSLRQAHLLVGEPLGMLSCLTAEEEAAAFLYYALRDKGYSVPEYGKIHGHAEKIKLLIFSITMQKYFFEALPADLGSAIRIERDGAEPKLTNVMNYNGYSIIQDDFLETIVAAGEGETGHDLAIEAAVDKVFSEIIPRGFTVDSHIKKMANRRNFCLYGKPADKLRLRSVDEINHFRSNCVLILVLGLLVFKSEKPTVSMAKLVDYTFKKHFTTRSKSAV